MNIHIASNQLTDGSFTYAVIAESNGITVRLDVINETSAYLLKQQMETCCVDVDTLTEMAMSTR